MLDAFSKVIFGLYQACREQPAVEFQNQAFECLKTAIDFDSAVWLTSVVDPDSDTATFHTRNFYKQSPQLLVDWMKCEGATVFPRKLAASPNQTFACTPSTDMPPQVAAHCRAYNIEQILTTAQVEPIARIHELISLYRADLNKPFTEDERLFQQSIVPHLAETWRLNRMLHLSHASQPTCVALLRSAAADEKGILHLIEPGFTHLLRDEWPDWQGPRLPTKLAAAIENKGSRFVGKKIAVKISALHDQFLLRGRKKNDFDNLSSRKREVANYFAEGHTHKDIARLLDLSPATVRNYLTSIYTLLGISSKAELANILNDYG